MHVAGSQECLEHLKPKSVRNVLADRWGRTWFSKTRAQLFWSKLDGVDYRALECVEHWNPRRDVGSLTLGSMEQCREQSFVSCED